MIQHDEYIEFDLKGILFYILRCWKTVVLVALAVAVTLGGFQAVLCRRSQNAAGFESQYQAYQEQLAVHDDSVSAVQEEIDILQDYLDHSVLMQMDPQNAYIAKATYHIDSGYMIIPENYYQDTDKTKTLTQYYRSFLQDSSFYQEISAAHGIALQYLMELIDVPDDSTGVLSFSVMHPEKEVAQALLQDIQEKLPEIHRLLETTVREHALIEISTTCSIYVNNSLKKDQDKVLESLLDLEEDLEEEQQARDAFVKSDYPVQENASKIFVKWFILGGVLGVLLTAVFLFLKAVLSDRLLSPEQLASAYPAAVLGEAVCSGAALPVITRKLNKMQGCLTENTACNWQIIAQKVKHRCGNAKSILVCSDMGSDLSSMMVSSLSSLLPGLQLIPAANPCTDIAALRMVSECDMVLIVAARDQSRNRMLKKVMALIQEYRKETVGFLITY